MPVQVKRAAVGAPAALLVPLIAFVACDPGVRIEGSVSFAGGAPIPSARVVVTCPEPEGFSPNKPLVTDVSGRFLNHDIVGCMAKSCVVVATLPDGSKMTEKVSDHCLKNHWYCKSMNCNKISVDFTVKKAGAAGR